MSAMGSAAKVAPRTALDESSSSGAFVRKASTYRSHISEEQGAQFPPEAGRYHLYVSYACPWAHRTLIFRNLKGLDEAIGVTVVHPTWEKTKPDDDEDVHCGWVFKDEAVDTAPIVNRNGHGSFTTKGSLPDKHNGAKTVRELYELSNDTSGKYTVPILWDLKTKQIVNNESSEIIRMFNGEFQSICKNPTVDLCPVALKAATEEVNEWVLPTINDGVYRCGFAIKQEPYQQSIKALFDSLDRVEDILSQQRYIVKGSTSLTEADIRLFVTLIRFDEVYVVYFKTNKKMLREYPNILNYIREIYQTPGVAATTNIWHIKTHYFTSHPKLNFYGIVPVGLGDADAFAAYYNQPHARAALK